MHLRNTLWVTGCVLIGIVLCAENAWVTASRSLIPRSINNVLVGKELRREKHQGIDDVYLLTLDNGAVLEVDQPIFEAVRPSQRLVKDRWEHILHIDQSTLTLTFSPDYAGMLKTMPAAVGMFIIMGIAAWRSGRMSHGH